MIWAVMRFGGAFRYVGRFGWQGGGGSGRVDSAGQPVGSSMSLKWGRGGRFLTLLYYYSNGSPFARPGLVHSAFVHYSPLQVGVGIEEVVVVVSVVVVLAQDHQFSVHS